MKLTSTCIVKQTKITWVICFSAFYLQICFLCNSNTKLLNRGNFYRKLSKKVFLQQHSGQGNIWISSSVYVDDYVRSVISLMYLAHNKLCTIFESNTLSHTANYFSLLSKWSAWWAIDRICPKLTDVNRIGM